MLEISAVEIKSQIEGNSHNVKTPTLERGCGLCILFLRFASCCVYTLIMIKLFTVNATIVYMYTNVNVNVTV
jgi:hypothetical protein